MILDESLSLDDAPDQWDMTAFRAKIFYQFGLDLDDAGMRAGFDFDHAELANRNAGVL